MVHIWPQMNLFQDSAKKYFWTLWVQSFIVKNIMGSKLMGSNFMGSKFMQPKIHTIKNSWGPKFMVLKLMGSKFMGSKIQGVKIQGVKIHGGAKGELQYFLSRITTSSVNKRAEKIWEFKFGPMNFDPKCSQHKVEIFWVGHKHLKKSPTLFWH